MRPHFLIAILASVVLSVAAPLDLPSSAYDSEPLAEVFEAMQLTSGDRVADVGAGASGSATFPMARIVGPEGRVWAVDIDEKRAIPQLKARVQKEDIRNVEVTVGLADDPKLPEGLDAVLVMNAYHEMAGYEAILKRIMASLKPGGRLVIVDNLPRKKHGSGRAEQAKSHVLAIEFAEAEVKAAGFSIVARRDTLSIKGHDKDSLWMIVAER